MPQLEYFIVEGLRNVNKEIEDLKATIEWFQYEMELLRDLISELRGGDS